MVAVFSDYAPDLHTFCKARLAELEQWDLQLRRPFEDAAFSGMTFDFGPGVCTVPHKDFKNLGFGWCSVTSLLDLSPICRPRYGRFSLAFIEQGPNPSPRVWSLISMFNTIAHSPVAQPPESVLDGKSVSSPTTYSTMPLNIEMLISG